jgi:preprotein translocase subunit SecY
VRTLIQAFKTKELRNKILFVLGMIIIYRIGSFIPTPGVNYKVVQKCVSTLSSNQENFVGLVNLFSGGAMLQLSIFALGVMPYITASIVIQLLRVVIPRFEALHKEGQSGETKLTQYTRYLTIGLAVLQSTTILVTARSGALFNYQCSQVIPDNSVWNLIVMVLVMTGGTGLVMWMAELITDKGIGQGMSVLIFMSICSGFLPQLWQIGWGTNGKDGNWTKFGIVTGVLIVILIFVDFVELAQRRIPVQYTPTDLRIIDFGDSDIDRSVWQLRTIMGHLDQHQSGEYHVGVVHSSVFVDDCILLLLLYVNHIRPR